MNTTPYVETDCTITGPTGQEFSAAGAIIADDYACAYTDNGIDSSMERAAFTGQRFDLTDWHGNKLGTFVVKSRKPGPYRHQYTYYITATINGRRYYGQTQGAGSITFLRAYKHQ